jgi:hypothetical protein
MLLRIAHAATLFFAALAGAAQAHEGPHLHPHLVADSMLQPLHPALHLTALALVWGASVLVIDAAGRAWRRRRG